jgi:OOP family OmpA-OmpF porin
MIKKILAVFFACVAVLALHAQEEAKSTFDRMHAGIRGGLNFPSLSYSNSYLNDYKSELYSTAMWGIFADIPLNEQNTFSLRPEINFTTRGQHIDDKGIKYEMNARYADIYLPVVYTFRHPDRKIEPFVLLSPVLGFASGGEITLDDGSNRSAIDGEFGQQVRSLGKAADISNANLSPVNFGLYGGAGLNVPIHYKNREVLRVGVELGYHFGLSDTYSKKEKDVEAIALNLPSYEIDGTRKHRGFQASVAVSVPLNIFKRKKKPAPVEIVPEPQPVVVVPVEAPKVEEKPCYTLDEMKDLIRQKKEIAGKKICAIEQITFEFNKSTLKPASLAYLNEIVLLMRENTKMKVTVNGHTDNVGSPEYNLNLSKARAMAVYNYLTKSGIESSRLSYEYFGMTKPIASNDTEEGRIINRRVEFEIINQ